MKLLFTNIALLAVILFSACVNNNPAATHPTTPQNTSPYCGVDSMNKVYMASDTRYKAYMDKLNAQIPEWSTKNLKTEPVYTIPVVFHVLYKNNTEKIARTRIIEVLNWLNKDFRKANINSNNIHPQFVGIAANTNIQFCLAKIDTLGHASLGVEYKPTTRSFYNLGSDVFTVSTGGARVWNPTNYLNIYICDLVSGIRGYATSGYAINNPTIDGVLIDFEEFNTIVNTPLYLEQFYSTLAHEIGHYFGLNHIFGYSQNGSCTDDDGIFDTPVQFGPDWGATWPSSGNIVSCSNTGDMYVNFMDYSASKRVFSIGQKNVMRAYIDTYRPTLLSSNVCNCPTFAAPTGLNFRRTPGECLYEAICNPVPGANIYEWSKNANFSNSYFTNTNVSPPLWHYGVSRVYVRVRLDNCNPSPSSTFSRTLVRIPLC